jgi:hypothetical protein
MADITSVDLARVAGENLEQASPDLLRAMLQAFAEALMGAEADAVCGAPYGQVSEDRVNYRNGYRERRWDTRTGTEPVAFSAWRCGGSRRARWWAVGWPGGEAVPVGGPGPAVSASRGYAGMAS